MESEFWWELKTLAKREEISLAALITRIDEERGNERALSSALRLHVLRDLKSRLGSTC